MAKLTKNNGKFQEDATVGKFRKDARSTVTFTSATDVALANGATLTLLKARRLAALNAKPRMSFKFLSTGK